MFRRGFPFRPPMPFLGFLNPMLQRLLGEANQAFESGDYAQAAERYTHLAERAVIRGKSRAGNWLIKAGQANVLAGNRSVGMQQVIRGMEMLRTQGRQRDLGRLAWRTIELFKNSNLNDEAQQISDWIQGKAPDVKVEDPDNRQYNWPELDYDSVCHPNVHPVEHLSIRTRLTGWITARLPVPIAVVCCLKGNPVQAKYDEPGNHPPSSG